mgnify:CR=1 FL=1
MFYIGCHLSAAKGYLAMGKEAVKLGANVFHQKPQRRLGEGT